MCIRDRASIAILFMLLYRLPEAQLAKVPKNSLSRVEAETDVYKRQGL